MSKRIISSIFLVFLVLTQTFADDVFYFAEDSDINDYDDRELTTGDITTTGTVSTTEGGMGTTGTTGTTGAMSTTGPNGGGTNTTTVYEISVSETENTTATLNSTAGYIVEITFPPLVGGYSARYSQAASDVAGFEDPTTSMPTNGKFKGVSFFITLMKDDSVAHVNFTQPIIVKVVVPEGSSSDAIYLFNTDNLKWEDAAETCNPKRFINNNGNIELGICHLTQFAVFEVTTSQSSTTTTGGAAAVVDEPSEGDDAGLIAAVIIIPIVIVGVIISLVAWTLLRNPEKSRKEKDLEMTTKGSVGNTDMAKSKPLEDSSSSEVESSDEDDDDDDSAESSDDAPKNKNDSDSSSESEKGAKPKAVAINVKKQNRDSSSESSESSSDSDEPVRKNTQKQKKEESSDESDDTTETSDSD